MAVPAGVSAALTGYGTAVVVACVVLAVTGHRGWAVALFLLSFVVDASVVLAVRRRRQRG